jgi:hypothetical protein
MATDLKTIMSMYTSDGPSYNWNPYKDMKLLDKYADHRKFPSHHTFENCQQALVVLGQSVKHSAHMEIKAANEIRSLKLEGQLIPKADSPSRSMLFIRVPPGFVSLESLDTTLPSKVENFH